ncbi:thiamine phosphate synthase [Roseospira marina]|uniref:Thiamine-phosphate synthase n=1 Tax=Roseospira marina TaxID=140057 RepID=A0A5M6IEU7_9PROT|nr:thiamine phosphate synthase [Roseospira marina]KAA5606642.1 thiamine phosphate synthase [Roseospira marina]MBB4313953.1 thiamine-phosphate pyrophosphorylase [Roseospira marina]MBB5087115.1 thiamine-phosphate pyrophosphorylase [Roseospira marina]
MAARTPEDRCRLYLITPPRIDDVEAFATQLSDALDGGDVACLQIRLKEVDDDTVRRVAAVLVPLAQARDVAVILNDRPDLAVETGCDGVHVGQEDASLDDARAVVGADGVVGVTCHDSRHLAMEAGEGGADYVAFGAFFPTETKDTKTRADIELLQWWAQDMLVPSVAIGGILVDNAQPLIEAGADFLAVCAGVWDHPEGPKAAVARFNALMDAHSPDREPS